MSISSEKGHVSMEMVSVSTEKAQVSTQKANFMGRNIHVNLLSPFLKLFKTFVVRFYQIYNNSRYPLVF